VGGEVTVLFWLSKSLREQKFVLHTLKHPLHQTTSSCAVDSGDKNQEVLRGEAERMRLRIAERTTKALTPSTRGEP
jgi:hypothetical protein